MENGHDAKKLKIGDVVEVKWLDAHAVERLDLDEVMSLEDPDATTTYGVVTGKTEKFITIATSLGSDNNDGSCATQLPFGIIDSCKVLAKRELQESEQIVETA